MRGAMPPLRQYVFMAWCLVKHRDNFTFIVQKYIADSDCRPIHGRYFEFTSIIRGVQSNLYHLEIYLKIHIHLMA
jgi:hypothetical protein